MIPIATLLLVAATAGPRAPAPTGVPDPPQPFDQIVTITIGAEGRIVPHSQPLPPGAYRDMPAEVMAKPRPPAPAPLTRADRLDTQLLELLAEPSRSPPRTELIILMPDTIGRSARGAGGTSKVRNARYRADSLFLARHHVRMIDRSDFIQAMLVDAPVDSAIVRVVQDTLQPWFIQLRRTHDPAPSGRDGEPGNNPVVGRFRIQSDPWRDMVSNPSPIALVDRRVLWDHELLGGPQGGIVREMWDCVGPASGCDAIPMNAPPVPTDCINHGTRAAGILSGRDPGSLGFDGVTRDPLHVYEVYDLPASGPCGGLADHADAWATVRAIEAARTTHRVIVTEVACHTNVPNGYPPEQFNAIATAAQEAFREGSLVVAAAGNMTGAGHVASPAVARCAIAVGAYAIMTNNPLQSGRGPTLDGRTKPELIAPTSVETANGTGVADYSTFDATSGAVPFVGGSAALVAEAFAAASNRPVDPGQVAAGLILAGRSPSRPNPLNPNSNRTFFDPIIGAGRFELPPPGSVSFGKVGLCRTGQVCEIPIEVADCDVRSIEVALWWPESEYSRTKGTLVTAPRFELPEPCPPMSLSDFDITAITSWWVTHNDIDLVIESPVSKLWLAPTWPAIKSMPRCFPMWHNGEAAASRTDADVFERATATGFGLPLRGGTWKIRIIANQLTAGPQVVYWAAAVRK